MLTSNICDLKTSYYLRIHVKDRPKVLGVIATEFGNYDVSLAAMEMKTLEAGRGEIVFLTHPCREKSFCDSLEALKNSGTVETVCNWFRVEDSQ